MSFSNLGHHHQPMPANPSSSLYTSSFQTANKRNNVHHHQHQWYYGNPIRNYHHRHVRSDVSLLAYIRTNLESIAEERYHEPAYRNVEWMDPSSSSTTGTRTTPNNSNDDDGDDSANTIILPIYPIPAVYLPIGNHTLNNVEPRNLNMALDLNATLAENDNDDASSSSLFCVTLMAADTGKIATTGTLLKVMDIEPTYDPLEEGKLLRITVYCQAKGIVEICSIENPEAASREQRLLRSSEYLKGKVRIKRRRQRAPSSSEDSSSSILKEWKDQISTDFRLLKTMYELGIWGAANNEMPPNAMTNLATALPDDIWQEGGDDGDNDSDIWRAAQIWQSLCLTIQAGKQQILNSDRNELMVEAVTKNGGPLKLPIHLVDLELPDRRRVQELETKAERDFLQLNLDPTLDFLALLSLDSLKDQLQWLGEMVSRERRRMEQAALEYTTAGSIDEDYEEIELQGQGAPKGAWFDDDLW